MDTEALKPILAGLVRHGLTSLGGALVAGGYMQSSDTAAFVGGGMVVAGMIWSWWQKEGQAEVSALLKKVTATKTKADAVKAAEVLPPAAAVDTPIKSASVRSVTNILIVAFLLSLFLAGAPAMAQTRLHPPAVTGDVKRDLETDFGLNQGKVALTGNPEKDMQALWQKIVSASNADLQYASALAGAANTNGSKVRKQCWDAIIALNQQANGANLKNPDGTPMARPDPHLFTDVETLAETLDNLSPQGTLFTSCAGAAQLAKTGVLQFVNAAVAGAAGLAQVVPVPGL